MTRCFTGIVPLLLFLNAAFLNSQELQKIKFKKSDSGFYFFQKGQKSDTIVKGRNDLFYLIVPDSLKRRISIYVDNGQMLSTFNDSIIRLNRMQGLKYESIFTREETPGKLPKGNERKYVFTTLIDGTSRPGPEVRVRIEDRRTGNLLLENRFWFPE